MSGGTVRALALAMTVALVAPAASAQNFSGGRPEERSFAIESSAGRSADGALIVEGWVTNRANEWVRSIVLLIQGFDGGGRAVSRVLVYADGDLGPGGRNWFRAKAPSPGESFTVTVHSFDWLPRGTN